MGEKMDHLNTIVEQILTFARNAEPSLKPTDINKLINDLRVLVRRKMAQQNVELEIQLEDNPHGKADGAAQSGFPQPHTQRARGDERGSLTIESRTIQLSGRRGDACSHRVS